MPLPSIPKAEIYSVRPTGEGSLDSAALWGRLQSRTLWIEQFMRRASGWAHGESDGAVGAETSDIARFKLPDLGRASPVLRVYLLLTATGGSADYEARILQVSEGGGLASAREIALSSAWKNYSSGAAVGATLSATGGYYVDLDLAALGVKGEGIFDGLALQVRATDNTSASHTIRSVSVLAKPSETIDGDAVPTAWVKLSTEYVGTPDTADSVIVLKRLRDQQNTIAGREPRVLALHSFGGPIDIAIDNGGSGDPATVTRDFVLSRGTSNDDVTLAVYVDTDTAVDGLTITLYADPIGSVGSTSSGSATVIEASGGWSLIPCSGGWSANVYRECRLEVSRVDIGGGNYAGGGVVSAFAIFENERTESDYKATGDTMPSGVTSSGLTFAPRSPIVASWGSGPRVDDRKTLAENVQWQGWRRSQCLAQDYLYAPPVGKGASPSTIWQGYHVASHGTTTVDLWALLRRDNTETNRVLSIARYIDGSVSGDVFRFAAPAVPGDVTVWRWVRVGSVPVTAGTGHALALVARWQDLTGNSASTSSDDYYLGGVVVQES